MTWTQSLQISLEVWGALFCILTAFAIWLVHDSKTETLIVRMEIFVSLLLVMDALAWAFRGYPGDVGYVMVRVSNFFVFVFSYVVMIEFGKYVAVIAEDKVDFPVNTWLWAIYMIGLTGIAMVVVNLFTGFAYTFDAANYYHRTENYYLLMVVAYVGSALDAGILIFNAKCFEKKWFWSLMSYLILPTVTAVFQLFHYGLSLLNFSLALSMLLIFLAWLIDRSQQQMRQKNLLLEQQAQMAIQEKKIAQMQQDLMLSQIQPHFLYNSLTAIAQLCEKDPQEAKQATIAFSEYLRGNMDALKSRELIPFEKELKHIENYLNLEHIRFGDALEILYDIETVDFHVPVLSVQPIVENAIKHGIRRKGIVLIRSQEFTDAYEIAVIDDGVGFDRSKKKEDGRSHIGIESVQDRLDSLCGGTLTFSDTPGGGTTATIRIPKS